MIKPARQGPQREVTLVRLELRRRGRILNELPAVDLVKVWQSYG